MGQARATQVRPKLHGPRSTQRNVDELMHGHPKNPES
jgi:hypothetical protein